MKIILMRIYTKNNMGEFLKEKKSLFFGFFLESVFPFQNFLVVLPFLPNT